MGTRNVLLVLSPRRGFRGGNVEHDGADGADHIKRQICVDEVTAPVGVEPHNRGRGGNAQPKGMLEDFGFNVTESARKGEIDPVIGRDQEITRVIEILNRRTKNNPVLIGEPGVGKTAIAEGLATRIINGDIPDILEDKKLIQLDMGLLVA